MIPRQLRLYNFMSYQGETELDFRGIHVACYEALGRSVFDSDGDAHGDCNRLTLAR